MKNINQQNSGFTLIETLVAIFLLMITVASIVALSSKILISTKSQKSEITAQYLLQDGVEFLHNNRDSALNGGATWASYSTMGSGCPPIGAGATVSICECVYTSGSPGYCSINSIFDEVMACPPSGCPNLMQVENSGQTIFCSPSSNCPGFLSTIKQTSFNRKIMLEVNPMNPDEMFVDVIVSWLDQGGVVREKYLKTSLFNW